MLPGADGEITPAATPSNDALRAAPTPGPFGGAATSALPSQTATNTLLTAQPAIKPLAAAEPVVAPVNDNCGSRCVPCGDSCSLIAGGQATFLWPNFHLPSSSLSLANTASQTSATFSSNGSSINNDMIVAPRIWLGVQGPCWGLIGRYWNASVWNSSFSPALPLQDSFGTAGSSRFNAYLADLEVQRLFCSCCWSHRASFGVRYGGINLDNDLTATTANATGTATSSVVQNNQFFGTGLTWGLFSLRPIRSSCWSIYLAPRVSVLWGQGQGAAQASAFAADNSATAFAVHGGIARGPESLFIGEFQWGAQWERQLVWSPARAFIRIGGEYQYWDTNSNHGASAGSVALVPSMASGSLATANGGFLFNMVGFTFGAGIIY